MCTEAFSSRQGRKLCISLCNLAHLVNQPLHTMPFSHDSLEWGRYFASVTKSGRVLVQYCHAHFSCHLLQSCIGIVCFQPWNLSWFFNRLHAASAFASHIHGIFNHISECCTKLLLAMEAHQSQEPLRQVSKRTLTWVAHRVSV